MNLKRFVPAYLGLSSLAALLAFAPTAAADDAACPPKGLPKSGYRPVMPSEIACAVKQNKSISAALSCKLGKGAERSSIYVLPGMKLEILGPASQSPVRVHVKLPNAEEGDVDSTCLS